MWCPDIYALFPAFDQLDDLYMPTYSRPGSNVFYTVLYGNEITTLLNGAVLDLIYHFTYLGLQNIIYAVLQFSDLCLCNLR